MKHITLNASAEVVGDTGDETTLKVVLGEGVSLTFDVPQRDVRDAKPGDRVAVELSLVGSVESLKVTSRKMLICDLDEGDEFGLDGSVYRVAEKNGDTYIEATCSQSSAVKVFVRHPGPPEAGLRSTHTTVTLLREAARA